MNPSGDDSTAKNPLSPSSGMHGRRFPSAVPAPPAPLPPRSAGGLRSALKLAIPVVALIGVVFGITFFAQYAPPTKDENLDGKGGTTDPPLRFFTSARSWNPPSFLPPVFRAYTKTFDLDYRGLPLLAPSALPSQADDPFKFSPQDRAFPAFYEPRSDSSGLPHTASFWFENTHQQPVSMKLKYVSCGACSGGRVASISPDVTRQILQMSRVSILPQGLFTGLATGMLGPAANLDEQRLEWQKYVFRDHPDAVYTVRGAGENADGWSPQWGILQLQFSVGAVGFKKLEVHFDSAVEGSHQYEPNRFIIVTEGTYPFELTRSAIELGELTERSEPRQFEVIAYSSTRGHSRTGPGDMGDFAPPTAVVRMPQAQGGDPGKFIQVSPPERISDAELGRVSDLITEMSKRQRFVRVEGAYRYTVTVNPRLADSSIDLGVLDREIRFAIGDGEPRVLRVTGMVSGSVWLDNNLHEIVMPNAPINEGFTKSFKLITARQDLGLELLKDQWRPHYLGIKLEKDANPPTADRGYYSLTVTVPSSKQNAAVRPGTWSGEIVLEVKGPTNQRVRIPVKGRITLN